MKGSRCGLNWVTDHRIWSWGVFEILDKKIAMNLTGQLVRVTEISVRRRDEMYALMKDYYENIERSTFDADLNKKEWVIEIADGSTSELKGFSSQALMHLQVDGRSIRAIFSGDTIVDRDWRGQQRLFQISGWFLRRLMDEYRHDDLYWFLISKGYKTYRFLPLFFREFYPRSKVTTPPQVSAVIDALAMRLGPSRYDRQTGVLRAGPRWLPSCGQASQSITAERLRDEHVRFFADVNPGHAEGDELCCIAPLTPANFTPAAYRAMGPEPPVESVLL